QHTHAQKCAACGLRQGRYGEKSDLSGKWFDTTLARCAQCLAALVVERGDNVNSRRPQGEFLRSLKLTAAAVSALLAAGVLPAAAAHAASAPTIAPRATVGTAPTEFYFASGAGDYIGQGSTVDYTDAGVTFTASSVTVTAGGGAWTLN